MREMPSSLGERLNELRTQEGWTLADLARRLKVGRAQVWNYEQNTRFPRHDVLLRISKLLKTPVGDLYGETAGRVVADPARKKKPGARKAA